MTSHSTSDTTTAANTALLIVDVQNDFLPPDGSLAVEGGRDILPCICALLDNDSHNWPWRIVVASQDYHPRGHVSFHTFHDGYQDKPFSKISVKDASGHDIDQMLWPEHCIQGTRGCEIEESVDKALQPWKEKGHFHLAQKGIDIALDAYSAFATSSLLTATAPLAPFLKQHHITRLIIVGIATDVCVLSTARDAMESGFEILLVEDGCRGVDADDSRNALDGLRGKGAKIVKDVGELKRKLRGSWVE